jgi:hypothetical protein
MLVQILASMEEILDSCSIVAGKEELPEFASIEEYLNPFWHRGVVIFLLEDRSCQILSSIDVVPDPCRHKEVA